MPLSCSLRFTTAHEWQQVVGSISASEHPPSTVGCDCGAWLLSVLPLTGTLHFLSFVKGVFDASSGPTSWFAARQLWHCMVHVGPVTCVWDAQLID